MRDNEPTASEAALVDAVRALLSLAGSNDRIAIMELHRLIDTYGRAPVGAALTAVDEGVSAAAASL